MTDTTTNKPIRVLVDPLSGPYIDLPREHVEAVTRVLQENGIGFWVGHLAISVAGGPAMKVINLDKKCDPKRVQEILDAAW